MQSLQAVESLPRRHELHGLQRVVPIEDADALDVLADWLYLLFNEGGRQTMTAPLFTCIGKGGASSQERLAID